MTRSYFKHNKVKTLELITPKLYITEDLTLSGLQVKIEHQLINTHLLVANVFSSVLNVSTVSSLEVVSPYFVKQNKLTNITPFNFEADILLPLGVTYSNFATSALFKSYVSGTLLPSITLNNPTAYTNSYLISKLGWFYFLNTSGTSYNPSTYVSDKLVDLYFGKKLETIDGIKGFENYLFYNYPAYIPTDYVSGVATYTSGTQQLNKLHTLIDVVYSPLVTDEEDYTVKDAFEDYISTKVLVQELESKGPFYRFLKAISYGIHDIDDEIESINKLYDLEKCPDRFLPLVAELIGWQLFGSDPNRWRLQLRNAVELYKAKGTKAALQGAIDSIFSEGFLSLSGDINELYESYIPHLIYYGLATESPLLSSFQSWNPQIANSLGVPHFTNQSMDTNIRYVVDAILLDIVRRFNSFFRINNEQWNVDSPNFRFKYRNQINKIPPFEEIKWYKDIQVTEPLVDFIADKVACFGVSSTFLEPFRTYIKNKTVNSSSLLELDNRWLFFYSGIQLPPNYNQILSTFDRDKFKYVGLWSGKSSHFNLNLIASSFTYSTKSLEASSTAVLNEALRAINAFAPAHAIPDINFFLENTDYIDYETNECVTRDYPVEEYMVSSRALISYYPSGLNMSSLNKRFTREQANDITDYAFSGTSGIGNLPRTVHRRRSLHGLLPTKNFYSRTGFNMPVITQPSTLEYGLLGGHSSSVTFSGTVFSTKYTGMSPLGFIPSALKFVGISSVSALPSVYSKCENLRSSSIYNGVTTSNTFPCRGLDRYSISSCTLYSRHGDTDRIFGIISKILYNRELEYWADYLATSAGFSTQRLNFNGMNVSANLANSSFSMSSFSSFENFRFNYGIHKVYKDWVTYFNRANLNQASLLLSGGKDLLSHAYGPLLYNGKFDKAGSALSVSAQLFVSSYDSVVKINNGNGSGVLSLLGSSINTYTKQGNTTNSIHVYGEYVNSAILKNVEMIGTSGASQQNEFVVYSIHASQAEEGYRNYPVKNPLVRTKVLDGFPRLVYHLSSSNNILIPEHDFKFSLKYFAGFDTGDKYGGATVGAWVHTEPQNGMVWTWTPQGKWELFVLPSALDVLDLQPYFITQSNQIITIPESSVSGFAGQCYNFQTGQSAKITLENLPPELFSNLEFEFNTNNMLINIPQIYFGPFKQVHKTTQNYVVEIFKLPSFDVNSYVLFDELSIIDKTLNDRLEEYTPEDTVYVLSYFKDLANNRASRQALTTSGYFYASGGSRINFREHPFWDTYSISPNQQVSALTIR